MGPIKGERELREGGAGLSEIREEEMYKKVGMGLVQARYLRVCSLAL